ncbi:Rel homology domain (RHD), DNA-binding domain,p53-like transcription factor, DNA-binding [Cinara cedri]|uniref:Rel homology domain (RHD), DNA-binding domain,p53-like transcription factor, DNA-binding n=1 Tax=Cinara cedri TaxID=506608 RepID=A0A5E4N2V3_9HEMI|nr:Rel homology domain (RHD), DNA-binding domain,p53-like transcription factor, DNA-binding [Cinara cedri]
MDPYDNNHSDIDDNRLDAKVCDKIGIDLIKNDTVSPSPPASSDAKLTKTNAFVKIIEQPTAVISAGFQQSQRTAKISICGVHSTSEHKTYPTIRLFGSGGRAAVVVVSCVTKSRPFRPHPHNVVGRENCKRGIRTVLMDSESTTESFQNLEIRQCASREEDIRDALKVREAIRVDPFRTGFSHRDYSATSIDLDTFRLCFQVFLRSSTNGKFITLEPVVSDVICINNTNCYVPKRHTAKMFDCPSSSSDDQKFTKKPYIEILEQPAAIHSDRLYARESVSAVKIVGVHSTAENQTYPTIRLVGSGSKAVVVVSCVTKSRPFRPHPHNVVGRENCKKGVCTIVIDNESMAQSFRHLEILQCAKREDIYDALKIREEIRVDPFRTGFSHGNNPTTIINLNEFRLCFQGFLKIPNEGKFVALTPVVSDPIYY